MSDQDLAGLAASTAKTLRWAGFLVAVSLAILLIDLQLKRSIGRQAVTASREHADMMTLARQVRRAFHGTGAEQTGAGRDTDHGGADRGSDVVSDTGVAAGTDPAPDQEFHAADHRARRARERPPGNGRRTSRPDSGS